MAEANRVIAEQSRVDAEKLRVTADEQREDNTNNAIKTMTDSTNKAIDTLNEKIGIIDGLRTDIDANTKADGVTQRSLKALWDLNKGISYRFEEDTTKAYQKQVLSGAKLGAVKTIGGKTIVMNQHFTELSKIESNGVTITYADGVITLNGTATQNWINFSQLNEKLNVVAKFYIKMTIIKNDNNLSFCYGWLNRLTGMSKISSGSSSAMYSQTTEELKKASNTGIADFGSGAVFNDVKLKIMIVNLTQMFGSGNEPSTVEEFESIFPLDYYPYNEGTLMSMGTSEVVEQGKNYFDFSKLPTGDTMDIGGGDGASTGKVKVDFSKQTITMPPKTYYANTKKTLKDLCPNITPDTYIITMNRSNIDNNGFIYLYDNDAFFHLGTPRKLSNADLNSKVVFYNSSTSDKENVISNIQIEKASTATSYAPYKEATYTIPRAILDLEGYGWGVNNVYNYVDYENKKFYKYVGRVDLGTLQFVYTTYGDNNDLYGFRSPLPQGIKKDDSAFSKTNNLLCSKYPDTPWQDAYRGTDKTISQLSQSIQINDSAFTDAEAFKNSLQGEYLYYELAEPVFTDISDIIGDTFKEPFEVEPNGSLTFKNINGDGYNLAVPNNIQYVVSLKEVVTE